MLKHPEFKAYNNLLFILAFLICLLSALAFIYNAEVTRFTGNNYFSPAVTIAFLFVVTIMPLIELGVFLYYRDHSHPYKLFAREVLYFYLTIAVIIIATNAVQLTPFAPIDPLLIKIDRALGFDQAQWMKWVAGIPWLHNVLVLGYASIKYQLILVPLIVIINSQFYQMRSFYLLLLISCLIGFSFYYFFPSKAPSSYINSAYFTAEQYATGIKFDQIHQHRQPGTLEGGLIAMPSFHTIWAWLCTFLACDIPIVFFILVPLNIILTIACVLLGWHYLADIPGSLVILLVSYWIYLHVRQRGIPSG